MKQIKTLLLVSFMLLGASNLMAQSVESFNLAVANPTTEISKLQSFLDKSDQAVADEKKGAKSRTWETRGQIYAGMANAISQDQNDRFASVKDKAMDYVNTAMEAYNKAKELSSKNADELISNLHPIIINTGVMFYQDEQTAKALEAFFLAQSTNPKDTIPQMYGTDLAYQEEDWEKFESSAEKVVYNDEIKGKLRYCALYSYYLKDKKEPNTKEVKEKALEVANLGLKAERTEGDDDTYNLLKSIAINLYVELDKVDDAISSIEASRATAAAPDLFNLGVLYEKKAESSADGEKEQVIEKAVEAYKASIEKDDTFDAYYNLAAIYFNKGAEIKKKADDLTLAEYNKKGKEIEDKAVVEFKKALPFFQKMYDLDLSETNDDKMRVVGPLSQIYTLMGEKEKASKYTKELQALSDE